MTHALPVPTRAIRSRAWGGGLHRLLVLSLGSIRIADSLAFIRPYQSFSNIHQRNMLTPDATSAAAMNPLITGSGTASDTFFAVR